MAQPIIVMKFGGSSLANLDRIQLVAKRIEERRKEGYGVVAVVSAQGDTTDELLERVHALAANPPAREVDMLLATGEQQSAALIAVALTARSVEAVSLTGWQAGIATDGNHRRARIHTVTPHVVRQALSAGRVAVVAGFQGISGELEVTTLGRGGSDLTAVALAASLGASCEIYSDVAGVFTADPRIVPDARLLSEIRYDEMMELAALGAQVLQGRAVEYGWHHGVKIRALSTFDDSPGTLVWEGATMERAQAVTGVAIDRHVVRVLCESVPDRPGSAAEIFGGLAEFGVNVDVIVQSPSREGRTDIGFTVTNEDADAALAIAKVVLSRLGGDGATIDRQVAKVSVVGAGMVSRPGVASRAFRAIADAGVNIIAISTSEIKISCLVPRDDAERSARALHAAFELATDPTVS